MPELAGSQTEKNLAAAFARESQTRNLYDFYSAVAKKEGFEQLMGLFASFAEHERVHAKRLLKLLGRAPTELLASGPAALIGKSLENLRTAVAIEREDAERQYPEFARVAAAEGFDMAAKAFAALAVADGYHLRQLAAQLALHEQQSVFHREEPIDWVCRKCGYVHHGNDAPEMCPGCLHPKAHFEPA